MPTNQTRPTLVRLHPVSRIPLRTPGAGNGVVLVLLALLVFSVYGHTLQSAWHLDDYANIVDNSRLHLQDLRIESIQRVFFANSSKDSQHIYRPVACLTLALNWYFHRDSVAGYHLVNICIHVLNAFLLFATIRALYRSPRLVKGTGERSAHFIALLAAVLWALNPIQTQAVTYVVQRMCSLAALFYLLGIYLYIRGRCVAPLRIRVACWAGCLLSFVLALGSKENAITLPLAILLVEILFFQDLDSRRIRRRLIAAAVVTTVLAALAAGLLFAFLKGPPRIHIDKLYAQRPFTMEQRLLTQPRVVVFHLSQIFYPLTQRLSIAHDVVVSTGWWKPVTTLPALALVAALVALGLSQIRRRPLVALGLLFFFLAHLVESTFLPLELIFEHRNYLPSVFLFLPVAAGIAWVLDRYRNASASMHAICAAFVTVMLMVLGTGTYIRNLDWATEASLWQDAIAKAPGQARPVINLASKHYEVIGDLDTAMVMYERALALEGQKKLFYQAVPMNNLAVLYARKREFQRAGQLFEEALALQPDYEGAQYNYSMMQMRQGLWQQAAERIYKCLPQSHMRSRLYNLLGLTWLNRQQPQRALEAFEKSRQAAAPSWQVLFNLGVAYSHLEKYRIADLFVKQALQRQPGDLLVQLYRIDNSLRAGDSQRTQNFMQRLVRQFSASHIREQMENLDGNELLVPFGAHDLTATVAAGLEDAATALMQPMTEIDLAPAVPGASL